MSFNTVKINNNDTNYTHSIFDISEYYNGATYPDLSSALAAIPEDKQIGGMCIRFIQNNNYIQYFCNSQTYTINENAWEKTNLIENIKEIDVEINGNIITVEHTFEQEAGYFDKALFDEPFSPGTTIYYLKHDTDIWLCGPEPGYLSTTKISSIPFITDATYYGIRAGGIGEHVVLKAYASGLQPTEGIKGSIEDINDDINDINDDINDINNDITILNNDINKLSQLGDSIITSLEKDKLYFTDESGYAVAKIDYKGISSIGFYDKNDNEFISRKRLDILSTDTELEIFNKMISAYNGGNYDVYWQTSTYIFKEIYEYMDEHGSEIGMSWGRELPVGNNCKYYFNGSTIISNRPDSGEVSGGRNIFGLWQVTKDASFEMYDGTLINNSGKYCVHDEGLSSPIPYRHLYKNILFKYMIVEGVEPIESGFPIGAGTGLNTNIIFDGCIFDGTNSGSDYFIHGSTRDTVHRTTLRLVFQNCYIKHSIAISEGYFDLERDDVTYIVNNCSLPSISSISGRNLANYFIEFNKIIL